MQTSIELKVTNMLRLITDLRRVQWAQEQGLGIKMLEESLFDKGEEGKKSESTSE